MTPREIARLATAIENGATLPEGLAEGSGRIVGITGPPGAGKSSLVDALTAEWRKQGKTVAILAVDPSSRATGGAILGDRIRMQRHHADAGVFVRSTASRGAHGGLARTTRDLARLFRAAGFDYVVIETVGVGQDEIAIAGVADVTVVALTPGMGDDVQAIKAGIMEIADVFVVNKADLPGAEKTRREIEGMLSLGEKRVPVLQTVATSGEGITSLLDEIAKGGAGFQPARIDEVEQAESLFHHHIDYQIDHLGIAVESIDAALAFYNTVGLTVTSRETVEHEHVRVAMLPTGESRIELLEATSADSAIAKFIAKLGPGLHHVALKVPDLAAAVRRLEASGARLLGPPQRGAGGHLYVFVHPASTGGVLWELIQQ